MLNYMPFNTLFDNLLFGAGSLIFLRFIWLNRKPSNTVYKPVDFVLFSLTTIGVIAVSAYFEIWRRENYPDTSIASAFTVLAFYFANNAVSYFRIKEDRVYYNDYARKHSNMKFGLWKYFEVQRKRHFNVFKTGLLADLIIIASLISLFSL